MWMLLEPRAERGASETAVVSTAAAERVPRTTPRPAPRSPGGNGSPTAVETLLAVIGAVPAAEPHDDVGIFLHPGRALLTTISLERLFDQFDCRARDVYASLDDAERAHRDDVGFLLEVRRAFTDNAGHRRDRGVLFAPSVRG